MSRRTHARQSINDASSRSCTLTSTADSTPSPYPSSLRRPASRRAFAYLVSRVQLRHRSRSIVPHCQTKPQTRVVVAAAAAAERSAYSAPARGGRAAGGRVTVRCARSTVAATARPGPPTTTTLARSRPRGRTDTGKSSFLLPLISRQSCVQRPTYNPRRRRRRYRASWLAPVSPVHRPGSCPKAP